MYYCTKCGRELEDNVRFCDKCGAEINSAVKSGNETGKTTVSDKYFNNSKNIIESIATIAAVIVGIFLMINFVDFKKLTEGSQTHVGQSKTGALDVLNSVIAENKSDSETQYTQSQTEKNSDENNNIFSKSDLDTIENHYPIEFIGKTVEETIDILGMPQDIKGGFLGGSGTDTAYLYDDGNVIFIALCNSGNNYDFDNRDARINYICIWDGSVNEYVEMGMSYNEINQFYSLSDYSYDAHDNCHTASADFMCNNYNCTLIITSSDGNKTTPINRILLTCRDIYN